MVLQGMEVSTLLLIVLDSETFALGPQKLLQSDEVVVTRLDRSLTSGAILTADKTGRIGALAGVSYADGVLDVATSTVSAAAVRAQQLTLTASKNAAILSTNGAGDVVGASAAMLDRVEVKQGLSITTKASLELQGREANTLLALNGKGELVTVPRPAQKGDASPQASPAVDAHLRELRATTASVEALAAGKAVLQELHLASAAAVGALQQEDTVVSGSLLVQSKSGRVSALSEEVLRVEKGSVYASSLHPANAAAPLQIHSALLLLQANLTASTIHNAASISTAALTVREQAEFLSDVVIDGSVTVHGTVVGSGPYVDSSDARLKKDVQSITGDLDAVQQLRGVTYNFRTEEFPERALPNTPQLGFLAQEVEAVLPQLVSADAQGYKGVAYAHVTAVLAEAVKELSARQESEVAALRVEVSQLRALVQELLLLQVKGKAGG